MKELSSNKSDDLGNLGDNHYAAWGTEEIFNPSVVYHLKLGNTPTRDIGIIGKMKDPEANNMFLLLGAEEVFILNNEGKKIERIY